jgi:cytochrome c oxidase assembly protein subunit 15
MELLAMIALQGVIGYTQYFTGLPEGLVAVHVLGASILWIAVLRVPLSHRSRGLQPISEPEQLVAAGREDRPTG